jgi:pyrroloquinoline quinone biosynthesis protein B
MASFAAQASWVRGAGLVAFVAASTFSSAPGAATATARAAAAYAIVLGTAQDAGIPQIGGRAAPDEAARRDPRFRRLVTSILVCDPATGGRWLLDASPDLREQIDRAAGEPPSRKMDGPRPTLVDGIFLSHAHIGHYLGLAQLGREAYNADQAPLHVSPRMAAFLKTNAPWDLLVRLGNVTVLPFVAGQPVALTPTLSVTPIEVPHRAEYTDTYAFLVKGPDRALLYLPDIDKWERWDQRIEDWIAKVDVALLDGTFYGDGEVPGRAMAEIPHPFISVSLARYAALPASARAKIEFTHLNHTNPAALPGTPARRAIEAAGMRVASEGERIPL